MRGTTPYQCGATCAPEHGMMAHEGCDEGRGQKTNSKSKNEETAAPVKAAPPVYAPRVRHNLRHSAEQLVASALATIACAAPVADENTRHAGASRAAEQK